MPAISMIGWRGLREHVEFPGECVARIVFISDRSVAGDPRDRAGIRGGPSLRNCGGLPPLDEAVVTSNRRRYSA